MATPTFYFFTCAHQWILVATCAWAQNQHRVAGYSWVTTNSRPFYGLARVVMAARPGQNGWEAVLQLDIAKLNIWLPK